MKVAYYSGGDVYDSQDGRVSLFQNDDSNLAVRHTGYWMYTQPFVSNNFDFAWRLAQSGGGIYMYNDYGGGWWAGYDQGKDQLILVASNDARIIKWTFNPLPSAHMVNWPQISHPDGRTWKNNGNAIYLNSGVDMRIELYSGLDVYGSASGMVALLQNGKKDLAVRHSGYVMWTNAFVANNFDFGWKLVKYEGGIRLYNGYGGGYWVGYEKSNDRVLIVPEGDPRITTWTFSPMPDDKFDAEAEFWTISMYSSANEVMFLPDVSDLQLVGTAKLLQVNFHSVADFQSVISKTPAGQFVWIIDGKVVIKTAGQYKLCITSDDGSYLYLNGNLVVSNGGLHGDVKQCSTVALTAGPQAIQVQGFNNLGGASQVLSYSGPDTNGQEVNMPCGVTTGALAPQRLSGFSLALFTAPFGLGSEPDLGSSALTYVGRVSVPTINVQTTDDVTKLFPKVQITNFAWAAFGKATIVTAGTYSFCITSDDGWVSTRIIYRSFI